MRDAFCSAMNRVEVGFGNRHLHVVWSIKCLKKRINFILEGVYMIMKKMKSFSGKLQNVTLLYFLFITTLVHLGYFAVRAESQSLVIFSLAFVFVYLIEKNMIIVLGISLVFTDLLYMIQNIPEGFTSKDSSCNDVNDPSCNKIKKEPKKEPMTSMTSMTPKEKRDLKIKKDNERIMEKKTPGYKVNEQMSNQEDTEPVNPLLQAYKTMGQDIHQETQQDAFMGSELDTVKQDSKKMKTVLDKIKENPDMVDSIKTLNGIDIHELNKLINNLNSVVDSFNKIE